MAGNARNFALVSQTTDPSCQACSRVVTSSFLVESGANRLSRCTISRCDAWTTCRHSILRVQLGSHLPPDAAAPVLSHSRVRGRTRQSCCALSSGALPLCTHGQTRAHFNNTSAPPPHPAHVTREASPGPSITSRGNDDESKSVKDPHRARTRRRLAMTLIPPLSTATTNTTHRPFLPSFLRSRSSKWAASSPEEDRTTWRSTRREGTHQSSDPHGESPPTGESARQPAATPPASPPWTNFAGLDRHLPPPAPDTDHQGHSEGPRSRPYHDRKHGGRHRGAKIPTYETQDGESCSSYPNYSCAPTSHVQLTAPQEKRRNDGPDHSTERNFTAERFSRFYAGEWQ